MKEHAIVHSTQHEKESSDCQKIIKNMLDKLIPYFNTKFGLSYEAGAECVDSTNDTYTIKFSFVKRNQKKCDFDFSIHKNNYLSEINSILSYQLKNCLGNINYDPYHAVNFQILLGPDLNALENPRSIPHEFDEKKDIVEMRSDILVGAPCNCTQEDETNILDNFRHLIKSDCVFSNLKFLNCHKQIVAGFRYDSLLSVKHQNCYLGLWLTPSTGVKIFSEKLEGKIFAHGVSSEYQSQMNCV